MYQLKKSHKGFQCLIYLKEIILRKDHSILTTRMKDIWFKNTIDLNIINHAERQVIDRISTLISDVIGIMR